MNNDNLAEIKKGYLASLKDPQASSALLKDLLVETEKRIPSLLCLFQPEAGINALVQDKVKWSVAYFSRQLLLTEHNFCRERIEHLLEVRNHLKNIGVKGFVSSDSENSPQQPKSNTISVNFTPSNNLQKFVREGDLLTIRTALRLELNDNSLTNIDLRNALSWTKSKVPSLMDPYSEKSFARGMESDQSVWNSQYYENQIVFLKTNFSSERFLHLIDVREFLRQQKVEGFIAEPPKVRIQASQSQQQNHKSSQNNRPEFTPEFNSPLKLALLIGGAVAALVTLLIAMVR